MPLAVEDVGAPRLLAVLEWALAVAKLWRRAYPGTVPHTQELMEELTPSTKDTKRSVKLGGWGGGTGTAVGEINSFGRLRYSVVPDSSVSMPNSPSASQNNIHQFPTSKSNISLASASSSAANSVPNSAAMQNKAHRRPSIRRFSFSKSSRRQSSLSVGEKEEKESERRPFDAIINFLPTETLSSSGDKERDKAILKSAILVTTLTRPYLVAPPAFALSSSNLSRSKSKRASLIPGKSDKEVKKARRWTFFKTPSPVNPDGTSASATSSSTAVDGESPLSRTSASSQEDDKGEVSSHRREILKAQLRSKRSRIIHVLESNNPVALTSPNSYQSLNILHTNQTTQAQARLIRSIEAFLLSFCFPNSNSKPGLNVNSPAAAAYSMSIPGISVAGGPLEADSKPARPYLMLSRSTGDFISLAPFAEVKAEKGDDEKREWSLIELILSGALEGSDSRDSNASNNEWAAHRAWIGSVKDVVIRTKSGAYTDTEKQSPSTPTQASVRASDSGSSSNAAKTQTSDDQDKSSKIRHRRKVSPQFAAAMEKRLPTPPEEDEPDSDRRTVTATESGPEPLSERELHTPKVRKHDSEGDVRRRDVEKREQGRRDVERRHESREKRESKDDHRTYRSALALERRITEPRYESDSMKRREGGHDKRRALGHEYDQGRRQEGRTQSRREEREDYTGVGAGKSLISQSHSRPVRTPREREKDYNSLPTPPDSQETIHGRKEEKRSDRYEEERRHRHREVERAKEREKDWERERNRRLEREKRDEERRSRSRTRITSDPSPSPSNPTVSLPSSSGYAPTTSHSTSSSSWTPVATSYAPSTSTNGMTLSAPRIQSSISQDRSSCISTSTKATAGSASVNAPSESTYSETPLYLPTPTSLAISLPPSSYHSPSNRARRSSESDHTSRTPTSNSTEINHHYEHVTAQSGSPSVSHSSHHSHHHPKESATITSHVPHTPSPLSVPIRSESSGTTSEARSPQKPSKLTRRASGSTPSHIPSDHRNLVLKKKRSGWKFWKALNSPIVGA